MQFVINAIGKFEFTHKCSHPTKETFSAMIKIKPRYYLIAAATGLLIAAALVFMLFFSTFSTKSATSYIYIDQDDTTDSIVARLDSIGSTFSIAGFTTLARHYEYDKNIKTGYYGIPTDKSTFRVFRLLQLGEQTPVRITVPSVRRMEHLAARLDRQLMIDSASIAKALTDNENLQALGFDTVTAFGLIVPNTYEVYWNMSADALMKRLAREHKTFWSGRREAKAKEMGMTKNEVITLASIVDWETLKDVENPTVAGLYLNRLRKGIKLQSDPTVIYAMNDLSIRRVTHAMLKKESPYNTYLNTGLPPGPIMVPSISAIDGVLNAEKHNYIFMCAKEDFSGTHNFATTFAEHNRNARKWADALNKRGIR